MLGKNEVARFALNNRVRLGCTGYSLNDYVRDIVDYFGEFVAFCADGDEAWIQLEDGYVRFIPVRDGFGITCGCEVSCSASV